MSSGGYDFFVHLDDLITIIKPIHEMQKMSEANKASIAYVFERWTALHQHLTQMTGASQFLGPAIRQYLDSELYRDRNKEQFALFTSRHITYCRIISIRLSPIPPEMKLLTEYFSATQQIIIVRYSNSTISKNEEAYFIRKIHVGSRTITQCYSGGCKRPKQLNSQYSQNDFSVRRLTAWHWRDLFRT